MLTFERQGEEKHYYRRRGIFLVIFVVICAVLKFGFNYWNHSFDILFVVFFCMILAMDSWVNEARYMTDHTVITDDRQFSYNPAAEFDTEGFKVIEVGGINVPMLNRRGGEGTIAVPRQLCERQGKNIRIYGRPHVVDFEKLHPKVRKVIKDHGLGAPYYRTSEFSTQPLTDRQLIDRIAELEVEKDERVEDLQTRIKELEDTIESRLKDLESIAEAAKNITGEGRFKQYLGRIFGSRRREEGRYE